MMTEFSFVGELSLFFDQSAASLNTSRVSFGPSAHLREDSRLASSFFIFNHWRRAEGSGLKLDFWHLRPISLFSHTIWLCYKSGILLLCQIAFNCWPKWCSYLDNLVFFEEKQVSCCLLDCFIVQGLSEDTIAMQCDYFKHKCICMGWHEHQIYHASFIIWNIQMHHTMIISESWVLVL